MSEDRGLWIGVALGAPLIAWSAVDAFGDAGRTKPAELLRRIVGGAPVVDLLVLPGALAGGRAPRGLAPLRWALAATATLLFVGWPSCVGTGATPRNRRCSP